MVASNLADRGMRDSRLVGNSRTRHTWKQIIIIIEGIIVIGPKVIIIIIIIIKDIILIRIIARKVIGARTDDDRAEVDGVQAHMFDRLDGIRDIIRLVIRLWNRKWLQNRVDNPFGW